MAAKGKRKGLRSRDASAAKAKKLNQCFLRLDSRLWRTTRMNGGSFSALSERAGARQTDFELIGRGGALLDVCTTRTNGDTFSGTLLLSGFPANLL